VDQHPRPWAQLAALTVALAVMAWAEMPPWQRQQLTARCRQGLRRVVARVALLSGRAAMRDELSGRQAEAESRYAFTERLSRIRDGL
jgi:hypothetical protein